MTYNPIYDYPEICSKDCKHVQCSSWGTLEAIGKPCRNRTPTNEQWKESQENAKFLRNLEIGIQKAMKVAMQPFEARLQRLENSKRNRRINSQNINHD